MSKTITIIGAGYVGLSTAAIFSNVGYKVYLVELVKDRLENVKAGKCFFYEKGMDSLIKNAVENKMLIPTDEYSEAIPKSKIIFSCVGTPDNPDGSSNLSYVFSAAKEASDYMKPGSIYVQKSTVPVGTGKQIKQMFSDNKLDVSYVSNPEFLREGSALYDTIFFDRIVVGGDNPKSLGTVLDLYKSVQTKQNDIIKLSGISCDGSTGKYIKTNLASAELIKVTANAFLALKISFANSVAKLADSAGGDIVEIMDAVGADSRIGRAFLNAGRGYGGGCFPKDVSGLIASAEEYGVNLNIMKAVEETNNQMADYIITKSSGYFNNSYKNKKIAVLGLAFKANTSDARKSPGIKIANLLVKNGAKVIAYDPKANHETKDHLNNNVEVVDDIKEAVKDVEGIFITTEWPEFLQYNLSELAELMRGDVFVDCVNIFDIYNVQLAGLQYIGVGRNGDNK